MVSPMYHPVGLDPGGQSRKARRERASTKAESTIASHEHTVGLGIPCSKPLFAATDLIALATTLACFVCAVCVITPQLTLSWHLGSELQIVVLGFLLGIMSLCTQTVLPTLFLIIETKFGTSRLQNYQAILTSRFMSSYISWVWRLVLLLFVILPIGLGVAYKRFFGGVTTISINNISLSNPVYTLTYPSLGDYSRMNNSVYELMSCNAGLWRINYNDTLVPQNKDYPVALGYNMVLLDSGAAALLDMPSQNYLNWVQGNLRTNETWEVSASVNATVARNNATLAQQLKRDTTFFNQTYRFSYNHANQAGQLGTFNSFYTWSGTSSLGLFPIVVANTSDFACMLGFYNSSTSTAQRPVALYLDLNTDAADVQPFRQSADVFTLTRERCTAKWRIDKSTVALVKGSCNASTAKQVSQELMTRAGHTPYSLDTLPVLIHSLGDFLSVRSQSPWRLVTYASAVASSYWARQAYILPTASPSDAYSYPPTDEQIHSSIATLRASWLLYLVLSVQPILTIIAVVLIACFHSTPLSRGFGLISVLAGISPSGLHLLRGAGLSGETGEPLTLKPRVRRARTSTAATTGAHEQSENHYLEYCVASESEDVNTPISHLARRRVYG